MLLQNKRDVEIIRTFHISQGQRFNDALSAFLGAIPPLLHTLQFNGHQELVEEILRLKKERNAVILSHNYQVPEVQDIADFVGDSLGLSQAAARTPAGIIIFCGVHFMAETASIICPDKKVLIPDLDAGCSLAATINADQLRAWKKGHPDAVVVSYINTTAEVKAESDYVCTSSNAVKVVNSISPGREILFLPDLFLGAYVKEKTGRNIEIWPGGNVFKRGHRVRIIISTSDFPAFETNPLPSNNVIYHDSTYPSRLILPIVHR